LIIVIQLICPKSHNGFMSENEDKEKIKTEREEMMEEVHQLELKEAYEQDEEYEESEN